MHLQHLQSIVSPSKKVSKICSICWSNNCRRFAVADADGVIHLFDELGVRKDKFMTKSISGKKGGRQYIVKSICFSPDDTKLVVAQSDNIIFIYKIGLEWGDKKTIVNKIEQNSSITICCWPVNRPNEIIFGLLDGRVKLANLRNSSKGITLYSSESPVVSMACSQDGMAVLSGHADGSIYRFFFKPTDVQDNLQDNESATSSISGHQKLIQHNCIPTCLDWGESIVVAGQDKKISFYSKEGILQQNFDYSKTEKEFTALQCNPSSGQSVIRGLWEEGELHTIQNLYTVSSISWKPDGSRVSVANICGAVELFDACIKRYRQGEFEFTFVSPSQVIVKRITTGIRIIIKSIYGYEIQKMNIAKTQYLVAYTHSTLLLADLDAFKVSEIPWKQGTQEKFYFDNANVCLVFSGTEITLVEYGINDVIGNFRTNYVSPHLVSVRVSYKEEEGNKKVAFLIDSNTIRIMDLISSVLFAKITNEIKIDWLELNARGTKLLFRDKHRQLHLFDIATQKRITLLTYCGYVQWVPNADVIVAQNRNDLCIWYSIDAPENVTLIPIKGEVIEIVRMTGQTCVMIDEGSGAATVNLYLHEGFIEYETAMEDKNYEKALTILDGLQVSLETEAMWRKLGDLAIQENKYHIAERCYSALGDVSRAKYLKSVSKVATSQNNSDDHHWRVKVKMAIFNGDFKYAEQVFLENGQVQEAMQMYEQVHLFEESINLAIAKGVPDAEKKKNDYMKWLIATKQEEKAAKIYEQDGKFIEAINLYLKGGLPARAANVVSKYDIFNSGFVNQQLLDLIADKLSENGLFEKAGQFYEKRQLYSKSIEAYRKGNAFKFAVELAKTAFPEMVTKLEEEWGDYLVLQRQVETSIHHYIEAGQFNKAIESAINSRQWTKAVQILEGLEPSIASKYYRRIARHYEEIQNYSQAKIYYLKANKPREAMEMFERANLWDEMQDVAESFLSESELITLYVNQASRLELKQKFKEAEKLFLKANEPDLAINMYKKNHLFDDMIRLVSQHRAVHLKNAHFQIAQKLENEGQLRQAEHHYIQAGDWKNAMGMYRKIEKWNEAIRVAKSHGPTNSWKKVAVDWATAMGGESGAKLLLKLTLIEEAIDYCLARNLWNMAFEMARTSLKSKLPDVHLKYAIILEENNRFKEAEEEYINAQCPKEAIEMYIHQHDWNNAMRVAETFDPSLISYIMETQAELAFQEKDYERAEQIYIQAKKPDVIIQKYKEIQRFEDAKRLADLYLDMDIQRRVTSDWADYSLGVVPSNNNQEDGKKNNNDPFALANLLVQNGDYTKAIETCLQIQQHSNLDYLESIWTLAVEIAVHHLHSRLQDTSREVVNRLMQLGKHASAINVLIIAEKFKEALDICIAQQMWDEAKKIVQRKPDLTNYLEQKRKQSLSKVMNDNNNNSNTVGEMNWQSELEILAKKGHFDKCIQSLKKKSEDEVFRTKNRELIDQLLQKYSSLYVTHLIKEEANYNLALDTLLNTSIDVQSMVMYKELIKRLLWKHVYQPTPDLLLKLKQFITTLSKQSSNNKPLLDQLHLYQQQCHLLWMQQTTKQDLKDVYTKICVALLRYCDYLPSDVLFYEAGQACRNGNLTAGMAFIFLNRYLDISEAIDEYPQDNDHVTSSPSSHLYEFETTTSHVDKPIAKGVVELENSDFQETDIPYCIPVPRIHHLDQEMRDDVTNLVLVESISDKGQHTGLAKTSCDNCKNQMYIANTTCHHCRFVYDTCMISGMPVFKSQKVNCSNCKRVANRNEWNAWIMKHKSCPHCHEIGIIQ